MKIVEIMKKNLIFQAPTEHPTEVSTFNGFSSHTVLNIQSRFKNK